MAVYVLRDAIERAGSLDADAVVAALEKPILWVSTVGLMRLFMKYIHCTYLASNGLNYALQDDLAASRSYGSDGLVSVHYL